MTSTLIRNARIIDGTGAPWYRGDLLIRDGHIARIGTGLQVDDVTIIIDASERYLSPGFIDAHCHDDLIFLRERDRLEKAMQGVTSIVVGNCSFSLYPAVKLSKEDLRQHFSGLLGETHPQEIFEDFQSYRRALEGEGIALNLVSLVGHAALRLAVMGHDRREATADELAAMCNLLELQMQQGAAGLSLGLVYAPSAFAQSEELVALGRVVARFGGVLAAHIRSYEAGLMEAAQEFGSVVAEAGVAGLLSHLQSAGRPNWGNVPAVIAYLEDLRRDGVDISFDMYPYIAGSTWILQLLPAAVMDGGVAALKQRLQDAEWRKQLENWVEHGGNDYHGQSKVSLIGWENVRLSAIGIEELKYLEGQTMDVAAAQLGQTPFDLLARFVEQEDGKTGIILFQLDEEDVHAACCCRLFMAGSDGLPRPGSKPHPRAFGSFPRIAGHLRRDKQWFSLEEAVRKMTSATAQRFSLQDRGILRPGMAADLVLFEDNIIDHATFENPSALPSGINYVFVNGQAVIAEGKQTGQRAGRVLI